MVWPSVLIKNKPVVDDTKAHDSQGYQFEMPIITQAAALDTRNANNPNAPIPKYVPGTKEINTEGGYCNDADMQGRGPEEMWGAELAQKNKKQTVIIPPNYRSFSVTVPASFPMFTLESWKDSEPSITLDIAGMAAPSGYGLKFLQSKYAEQLAANKMVLAPLTEGHKDLGDKLNGKLENIPVVRYPMADFGKGAIPLESMQNIATRAIGTISESSEADDDNSVKPAIVFHCAWGLGRTGIMLTMFKMAHNLYAAKDNPEAEAYAKRVIGNHQSLKIADVPLREIDDSEQIHTTTPAVALAIEEVRRAREESSQSVVMAIENATHVQALENFEFEMCRMFLIYKKSCDVTQKAPQPLKTTLHQDKQIISSDTHHQFFATAAKKTTNSAKEQHPQSKPAEFVVKGSKPK